MATKENKSEVPDSIQVIFSSSYTANQSDEEPSHHSNNCQETSLSHNRNSKQRFKRGNKAEASNFMKSIKRKDITKVKHDLDNDPQLATYADGIGISSLEEAVKSGSLEMLKLFIEKACGQDEKKLIAKHAILYAIRENHINIVKYLLDKFSQIIKLPPRRPSETIPDGQRKESYGQISAYLSKKKKKLYLEKFDTWKERKSTLILEYEDAKYGPFITPIVLAAKLERLEIIKYLIDKKVAEIHPITMKCPFEEGTCEICNERKMFKSRRNLQESHRLLEVYKALSSPGYIFESGVKDPILEVFELTKEMEQMKSEDPSFKLEYDAIAKQCRIFARDLMDSCRTNEEVEILLNYSKGAGRTIQLPRLHLALYFEQKEFVAHPYCQQVLQKSWYEGLPNWVCNSQNHVLMQCLYMMICVPLWPLACFLFMLKISPRTIKLMKYPINKFVTDTISFLLFLVLLFYNAHEYIQTNYFTPIEIVIIIWVFGMSCRQVRMFIRGGLWKSGVCSRLLNVSLRWIDSILILCFWCWIFIRIAGIGYIYITHTQEVPRNEWPIYHPVLISEPFYAAGTLLSFFRLTGLFQANQSLGPLQISLGNMIKDVVMYFMIFMVISTGFVVAITKAYASYKVNSSVEVEAYTGFIQTYNTLFWHIFGYGDIPGKNDDGPYNNTVHHAITENFGYYLIGGYHIVAVVVLLNMLIAMMATSFDVIQRDADQEWKFARTRLRLTYYSQVGSLPTPFNVMIIGSIMKRMVKCCNRYSQFCASMDYILPERDISEDIYWALMQKLSKRYMNKRANEKDKKIRISRGKLDELLKSKEELDVSDFNSEI